MKISVIGLGKLGLCTAACFASKGHQVFGFDNNITFLNELKTGKNPIEETGLNTLLSHARKNLHFVDSIKEAIEQSDISLIIVPTPSKQDGRFGNQYINTVLEEIGPTLKNKSTFHIIDIVSTVMPRTCETLFKPLLEKLSSKKCGEDFGLVYNPEFIALGSVIYNFFNPDMVLIGSSDINSRNTIKELYASTCESNPQFSEMSLTSAEIAKLSLNCYVTMKISFVNELASLCELTPDADIDQITNALGGDSRIGSKYLKAGLGFGGPCFPRDNIAFQAFAEDVDGTAQIGSRVVNINNNVPKRILKSLMAKISKASTIAILGLSYKPDTHIIEESQSILLIQLLIKNGYSINVYDPLAIDETKKLLGNTINYFDNPDECMRKSAAICCLTQWPEINTINWEIIMSSVAPDAILFDAWRQIKVKPELSHRYLTIGIMN